MKSFVANSLVHFDIAGPDGPALHRFYESVFSWKVKPQGPGYALVETPAGPRGAVVEAEAASLTVGVVVDDLESFLVKAAAQGGRVVMPVVDNGWVKKAQISDPAGNVVTVIEGRQG